MRNKNKKKEKRQDYLDEKGKLLLKNSKLFRDIWFVGQTRTNIISISKLTEST